MTLSRIGSFEHLIALTLLVQKLWSREAWTLELGYCTNIICHFETALIHAIVMMK